MQECFYYLFIFIINNLIKFLLNEYFIPIMQMWINLKYNKAMYGLVKSV